MWKLPFLDIFSVHRKAVNKDKKATEFYNKILAKKGGEEE